ncbi:MAG: (2Fe-2S)-binding protein [Pseudomonadota bacterium]
MSYTLTINGQVRELDVDGDMPLLWAVRDHLDLTGTKFGCGIAQCGACTVLVDGQAQRSCMLTVDAAAGSEITTIEGLRSREGQAVQKAWEEGQVAQCGYCQSGQVMSAAALLARNPEPDDAAIDDAMAGNLCRCGTYGRIREGIHMAAAQIRQTEGEA